MEGFEELLGVNFFNALFTLANTLAVFFVFKKFLYQPVMNVIRSRQQEIDQQLLDAQKAKQDAQTLQQEYEQKLLDAQNTSQRIVSEAVARGQAREEEILRTAKAEADRLLTKASADIAQEKKKAITEAKGEISDLAVAIAEKVVQREINAADQQALVETFLEELGGAV